MDPASHWLQLKNASVVCFLPVGCHTRCSILLHKKMIIRTRTCSTTYTTHTWQTRHVATKWLSDLLQWTYFCFSSVADKFTQTGAASFPKTNTHTHTHSHRHMNTHTHTHSWEAGGWGGRRVPTLHSPPPTKIALQQRLCGAKDSEPRMRWCLTPKPY